MSTTEPAARFIVWIEPSLSREHHLSIRLGDARQVTWYTDKDGLIVRSCPPDYGVPHPDGHLEFAPRPPGLWVWEGRIELSPTHGWMGPIQKWIGEWRRMTPEEVHVFVFECGNPWASEPSGYA